MEKNAIFSCFPEELRKKLSGVPFEKLREIRLAAGAPPVMVGEKVHVLEGDKLSAEQISRVAQRMCENSLYAKQTELRQGFITLPGGHRAGFCGRTVLEGETIRSLTEISSINLRVAHEIRGAADGVLPSIVYGEDVHNTLIISPPGCGKTTLLRDIARQLGSPAYGFRVGIADERGELAAMYRGVPQMDVGILTDVYAGCPKAQGMEMLLRGMAPRVVITDELGTEAEEKAVRRLIYAGVRVICSIHGFGRTDVLSHPEIGPLVRNGIFSRSITLQGVGKGMSIA